MPLSAYLLIVLTIALTKSSGTFTLVKHPVETGARCLDGSPAALYYTIGSEANKNKFIIFFEGGGLCTGATLSDTLQSCYKRSQTNLGSSAKYPATQDFSEAGILSNNTARNPYFHDWSKVYVPYCDGSEHQGSRAQPIPYKGVDLYFRGTNNSIQQFEALNQMFGLYSAEKVVFTGISAGGMAVYYWANYLYNKSVNKQVYAVPDSGLFLIDYVSPFTGVPLERYLSNLYKLMDGDVQPPIPECNTDFADPMDCFNANRIAKYLRPPVFVVESEYDQWSVSNILQLKCTSGTPGTLTKCNSSEVKAIEDYRAVLMQAIQDFQVVKQIGIWAPSCIQHGFVGYSSFNSPSYTIPSGSGITLAEALWRFVENPGSGKNIYIDSAAWPGNKGCSGVTERVSRIGRFLHPNKFQQKTA